MLDLRAHFKATGPTGTAKGKPQDSQTPPTEGLFHQVSPQPKGPALEDPGFWASGSVGDSSLPGKPTSLLLAARSFQKQGRLCAGGWEEGTLERSWRLALSLPFSHHAPALGNGQPWAWGLWGASVMSHWVQEENQPSPQTSGAVICRCTQGLVCGFLILLSVEGTFARKAGRFWLLSPQHPLC